MMKGMRIRTETLTKAQRTMLLDLGGHTERCGYHNPTKTYSVLVQRGLANPSGGDGWTLTDAGRALAAELAQELSQ